MTSMRFPKAADTKEMRRNHIIDTATRLIARNGLEGVSVRKVADMAGCSRGLVEHYFRDKAELVVEANRWVNTAYLERVSSLRKLSGLALLEGQLHNLLPFTDEILDEWRVRSIFFNRGSADQQIAKDSNDSFNQVYVEIWDALKYASAHGEIDPSVPVQEASELILLFVIGIAMACLLSERLRERRPLERRVNMILGMLKSGDLSALRVGDPSVEY
ncbi:TetR/AcrR family transcriptional regulator [Haliea sp.]|uniref:TetR/AcrR family transcriptional regulator n=1 Tax=Haliea sp. TaxID=1932666 RepID=UPI003528C0BB